MSTTTPNYGWILPGVNDPTDQDLWGGYLNSNLSDQDTVIKAISVVANAAAATAWPIHSIFMATVSTNPATLLGFGTWTALAAGRVLIGVGTGTDINGIQKTIAAAETGGEYQHAQTTGELASHAHTGIHSPGFYAGGGSNTALRALDGGGTTETVVNTTGSSTPMPWMQPYLGVYIWERTA